MIVWCMGPRAKRVVEQFPLTHCFGIGQKSKIFLLCCVKASHNDPTINLPNLFNIYYNFSFLIIERFYMNL